MTWLEEAIDQANSQPLFRQNPVGTHLINTVDAQLGIDTSRYSPQEYGNYYSTSNPVYSVVRQRQDYISMLPIVLFKRRQQTFQLQSTGDSNLDELAKAINRLIPDEDLPMTQLERHQAYCVLSQAMSAPGRMQVERMLSLEKVQSGAVWDLLNYVNPHWSFNRLIRMMEASLCLWGETYIFVEREGNNRKGRPTELWWANPKRVKVLPHKTKYIGGYLYRAQGGEEIPFAPWEVIRVYFPHPNDEFMPAPPLAAARLHADHESKSMKGNLKFHDQGLHAGAIISPKGKVRWTEEQAREIEDDINTRLRGTDRAHRWGAFRHEIQVYDSGFSPKDSEFIEGMNYDIARICNAFGWPLDLIMAKNTYENINQSLQMAWTTTVAEASYIAAELTEQLLPMFSRPGVDMVSFDSSHIAVLQESEQQRWSRAKEMIDFVTTRNKYLESIGEMPQPGGDRLWVPENMVPIDSPFAGAPSSAQVIEVVAKLLAGGDKALVDGKDAADDLENALESDPDESIEVVPSENAESN